MRLAVWAMGINEILPCGIIAMKGYTLPTGDGVLAVESIQP